MLGFRIYFENRAERLLDVWEREKSKMTSRFLAQGIR